jgi:hypothetical protein
LLRDAKRDLTEHALCGSNDFESGEFAVAGGVGTHFAARALFNPHASRQKASATVRQGASEEEIKRLTTREIFAYFKLIDRVDSRADIRRMVERAKWKRK